MFHDLLDLCPWPACVFQPGGEIVSANRSLEARWRESASTNGHCSRGNTQEFLRGSLGFADDTNCPRRWRRRAYAFPCGERFTVVVPPLPVATSDNGEVRYLAVWLPLELEPSFEDLGRDLEKSHLDLELALRSLNVRNRLLTLITREVRTAFNSIIGFSDMLQHRLSKGDFPSAEKLLQSIQGGANCTLQQLSRIETNLQRGDSDTVTSEFSARDLIQELVRDAEVLAAEKRLRCSTDFCLEEDTLHSDPLYLRLVLGQLLRQAVLSAMPESSLCLEARFGDETLEVRVHCSAVGPINLDATLNPMARDFLTVLGGEIGCEPIGDLGAVAWFRLGIPRKATMARGETSPPADASELHAAELLLVENDEFTSTLIASMLHDQRCTYSLTVAGTPEQAIELLQAQCPTLLILGMKVPTKANLEPFSELRGVACRNDVPVVALVNSYGAGNAPHLYAMGFDAILLKPFQKRELLSTLRRVLPSYPAQQPA